MRSTIYYTIVILFFLLFSCISAKHKITVTVIDAHNSLGVQNIKVFVGNVEHSSSASQVKMVLTNSDGVAKLNYYSSRKDAIQIRIEGTNGYYVVGDDRYIYYEYKRNISKTFNVKK